MTKFVDFQTNFTSGEIDPLLRARTDIKQYANGADKLTNVLVQPQGGVKRRPGLKHIYELDAAYNPQNGIRLVPFEFSRDDSYMLMFTNQKMHVIRNQQVIGNINGSGNDYLTITALTSAMLNDMCWTQSADTLIIVHEDLAPIKIVRGATNADWTVSTITFDSIPQYAFTVTYTAGTTIGAGTATLTPDEISGTVKITASSAVFSAADEGQYINATPQGRMRITEYVSTTVVNGVTEVPFQSTDPIPAANWEIESGYEDTWSASKGWPRTTTFHEGRLYFGGSKTRPSTVWGSKVGFYFEFQPVEAYDDDAVEATLDTNTYNSIVDIISGRDLQIFTTGGEFYVPQASENPVTPTSFFIRTASRNGAREGIRVTQIDSGTIYLRRQGKALSEFIYSDTTLSYVSNSISLLSSHLLKGPKEMALRKATSTEESDLLLIVNEDDGSMAAYSLLTQQQVVAPAEFITDGDFIEVGVDISDIYVVTKRTFNGTDKYFVEYFDSNAFTDCAFTGGAASGASSLPHEGATLNVIADGNVLGDEVVSSGSITFDRASTSSYEVGLPYEVLVRTMPIERDIGTGTRIAYKKRVVEVNAILNETQHININNILVPIRAFDTVGTLDNPTQSFSGIKSLYGIRGYSKTAQVTVKQEYPLKMTLLGLEYKVATSGGV
jgi:hypothetical protein